MTCAGEILELFDFVPVELEAAPLGAIAQLLLEQLRVGALTVDELVRVSGIDPGQASAGLMELELANRVTLEDGVYRASI